LSPVSGGRWNYTVIYTFTGAGDGAAARLIRHERGPQFVRNRPGIVKWSVWRILRTVSQRVGRMDGSESPLVIDGAGNLYGTGFVRRCIPHAILGGTDGTFPSGLILDAHGNAFGAALAGGATNAGLIFELTPAK